jgi:hypothetical protein
MTNNARTTAKAKAIAAEPFDADALLNEIKDGSRTFTLGGETFVLPQPTLWPSEAFRAANNGDVDAVAELVLGGDDYRRFEAVGGTPLFLQNLVEKMYGTSLGESAGSSSS